MLYTGTSTHSLLISIKNKYSLLISGPLLSGFENIPPLSQKQPGTFTHMLRRRFSRESKTSNDRRDSGKIILPFSLKARSTTKSGTELKILEDVGSSLMSERGYDSDARDIPTPTRANHMAASPVAQGFRRMELSDLVERSLEREESERWTTDQSPHNSDCRDSPLGMHYIPTPKSSLRGVPHPLREANNQHPALKDERSRGEHILQIGLARSLPNMNTSSHGSGPSISTHSPAIVEPDVVDDINFLAHWDQYLRRGQKNGMATSGSVPNLSTDALVAQGRQPGTSAMSLTDLRALHLGDLEISYRLASQTMSSGFGSHNTSSVDLARNNRHGQFMSSSHENLQPRQRSQQGRIGRRDPSSFYSHQGSHPSSKDTSPRVQSLTHIEKPIQFNQGTDGKPQGDCADIGFIHESRFREHCDAANSPPHHHGQLYGPNNLRFPRRVSAGWMSGGRRVGYGYSPVSGAEDAQTQHQDDDGHSSEVAGWRPPMKNERQIQSPSQDCRMGPQEAMESTIKEPRPIPPPMNPKRHELGAATVPQTRISPHSAKDYPMPPYLRAFIGSRVDRSSLDYETGAVWVDETNPPNFRAPEVPPTTQNEHCEVPQSSHYSTHPNDASATRWARLSRSMNVQLRARKNGEGLDGHEIGSYGDLRPAIGHFVGSLRDTAETPMGRFETEHSAMEPLTADQHDEEKDQAGQMHSSNSRSSRWLLKLSKREASRRLSNMNNQETSQASAAFLECDSSSAKRTNSTKSSGAEDPASVYQDCLRMPGSFDGSRWANRGSKVLWDLCTTEDEY